MSANGESPQQQTGGDVVVTPNLRRTGKVVNDGARRIVVMSGVSVSQVQPADSTPVLPLETVASELTNVE